MLKRMVQDPPGSGRWIPYQQWIEQQRAAELERQRRMPSSAGEPFDYSQRVGQSQNAGFDFTQRIGRSQKSEGYDFTF